MPRFPQSQIRRGIEILEERRLLTALPTMQVAAGSIAGIVHRDDVVADNRWQPGETGLPGVTIELLDSEQHVVATTQTDAAGQYRFDDVWPGTYALREVDATSVFEDIEVLSGSDLTGYDFSELPPGSVAATFGVAAQVESAPVAVSFPFVPVAPSNSVSRPFTLLLPGEEYIPNSVDVDNPWRLRVLNLPLAAKTAQPAPKLMHNASVATSQLRDGSWLLGEDRPESDFGLDGAIPLIGDFDGDGRDDLAIYRDGEWFLDLNGNDRWDDEDVAINLGDERDRPVVGDWNGDGRDDIGVYRAPASSNAVPVAGDFTGRGRDTIGLFQSGKWQLDLDGDGQLTSADPTLHFGEAGDIPVVGDFDGDGRDEIGVFRQGKWIIDSNHNGRIDAADQVFELGGAGDLPVVGDFNGDGRVEPGIYRASPAARVSRTP